MTIAKLIDEVTTYGSFKYIAPHNTERGVEFIRDLLSDSNNVIMLDVDLDVDGLLSTKIMFDTLTSMGLTNINVHIPSVKRHGIDSELLQQVRETGTTHLIITDSSTNSMAELKELSLMGVKVLIMDHHLPEFRLEDYPEDVTVISNKFIVTDLYNLSAGFLVYLFTVELRKELSLSIDKGHLVWGYVTLIADSCNLTCPYIRPIIIEIAEFDPFIPKQLKMFMTEYDILNREFVSYKFSNKINTLCRNSEVELIRELFFEFDSMDFEDQLSTIERVEDVHYIIRNNTQKFMKIVRQHAEDLGPVMFVDIGKHQELTRLTKQYLINATGVFANYLSKDHSKPCVVIMTVSSTEYKGSARDTTGLFDMHTALLNLIEDGGGHRGAVGFTLLKEDLAIFKILLRRVQPQTVGNVTIDCDNLNFNEFRNLICQVAMFNELASGDVRPITLERTVNSIFNIRDYGAKIDLVAKDLVITYFGDDLKYGDKVDIAPVYGNKPYGIVRNIHEE